MIDAPKTAVKWSGFVPRSNHAGHLIGVAELADSNGITIPGLTVEIEIKAPVNVDRCFFLFSLMQRTRTGRYRIYQLEIVPTGKRSHNGKTTIYGPHEHVGDNDEPTPVVNQSVSCDNWSQALQWFFIRVSLTPFFIENPNDIVKL